MNVPDASRAVAAVAGLLGRPSEAVGRTMNAVNTASAVALANGTRAGIELARRPMPTWPEPVPWHELDPRAALEVTSTDGWAWATAEGPVTLTGPGTDPHGPEVEALVDYYRSAAGEHPDWDEYRSVMVSDRRVLMTMSVDHVYGEQIR